MQHYISVVDPILTFDQTGNERRHERSEQAVELLGESTASAFFDASSWRRLRQAVAHPPRRGLELTAIDGRMFDASVEATGR